MDGVKRHPGLGKAILDVQQQRPQVRYADIFRLQAEGHFPGPRPQRGDVVDAVLRQLGGRDGVGAGAVHRAVAKGQVAKAKAHRAGKGGVGQNAVHQLAVGVSQPPGGVLPAAHLGVVTVVQQPPAHVQGEGKIAVAAAGVGDLGVVIAVLKTVADILQDEIGARVLRL